MRMLLINQNPVVSKLSGLSAQKSGFEVVETPFSEEMEEGPYEILFVDDAKLDEIDLDDVKKRSGAKRACLIYSDEEKRAEGFDYYLKKPFLPTEMVDLLSEIKDDMLLPEMEENTEEEPNEPIQEPEREEERSELQDVESSAEEEISQPLPPEVSPEATEEEEEKEENFDALLEQLEEQEEEGGEAAVESLETIEQPEAEDVQEEIPEELERPSETEEIDFEALMEEVKDIETGEEQAEEAIAETIEDEDIEALLEGIEIPQTKEEETVAGETDIEGLEELAELSEAEGGVLDEEQVNAVKELLEETAEPIEEGIESEELFAEELIGEGAPLQEAEDVLQEEVPVDTVETEEEVEELPAAEEEQVLEIEEPALETEEADELDLISENELVAALGGAAAAATPKEEPADTAANEGTELLAKLAGADPEALRRLLAGAQVTINITFPKEV